MSDSQDFSLVMPFIVCATNGGPYDDAAFVAGARFEVLRKQAESGELIIRSYEPTQLVPQLDLVAMRYGYTMDVEPWEEHPDEWSRVTLAKISVVGEL